MNLKIKRIFERIQMIINWLLTPCFLKVNRATAILYGIIILGCILIKFIDNYFASKLFTVILGCYMFLIMPIAIFKVGDVYLPKFIKRDLKTPEKLFSHFSHIAYLYGILIFAPTIALIMYGLISFLSVGIAGIRNFILIDFLSWVLFFSAFFTVAWFLFLVSNDIITPEKAKAIIALYIAISATISIFFIWPRYEQLLKPTITWLGLGYAWLQYFLERMDCKE